MQTTGSALLDRLMAGGRLRALRGPAFDEVPWARHMPKTDRWRGMFMGLAIGDALGNTSESMTPNDRRARYGAISHYLPNRYADQRQVGLPSDDTQLCAWAAEQIVRDGAFSPEAWLAMVSSREVFGMGRTVRGALRNLARGTPWPEAAQEAAGNGALMRCPGVFAAHLGTDGHGLPADAALFSAATHNDFGAISSAVAFTVMLAELLVMEAPPEPAWWLNRYVEMAAPLEGETSYEGRGAPAARGYKGPLWRFAANRVSAALSDGTPTSDACEGWYSGAYLLETVPSVLLILTRYADDPEAAILRAVNDTRDNDTTAAVVGAAVGALHGESALRPEWKRDLLGRTMSDDDGALFRLLDGVETMAAARELTGVGSH